MQDTFSAYSMVSHRLKQIKMCLKFTPSVEILFRIGSLLDTRLNMVYKEQANVCKNL